MTTGLLALIKNSKILLNLMPDGSVKRAIWVSPRLKTCLGKGRALSRRREEGPVYQSHGKRAVVKLELLIHTKEPTQDPDSVPF